MRTIYILLATFLTHSFALAAFSPANRPYDAQHYRIRMTIDPSTDPKDFKAETVIRLKTKEKTSEITLDAEDLKIVKIVYAKSWQPIPHKINGSQLILSLPKPAKANEQLEISVVYSGKINDSHTGLFKVVDPDDKAKGPLLFTHFEALSARKFFPCNDEPYDKATTEMQVMVPAQYEAISNGKKVMDRKFNADGKNWREFRWSQNQPHSTYLVSLAVAPLVRVVDTEAKPEVALWVSPKKKDRAKYGAQVTRQALQFFQEYTGVPYPWAKYAAIGVPTYLWGGMENTSATHMNEDRLLLNDPTSESEKERIVGLSAHELAHQWFGDYVTMKWWDDVWLNESFASYMATLATKKIFKNEQLDVGLVTNTWDWYFREEDGPRSHPIVDKGLASAEDAFDATNYTKGENILRMLSFYVGPEKFRAGITAYLRKASFGNATYVDFFDAVEKASGESLVAFRDSWLLQRGYPVVSYGGQWDAKKSVYRFTISQRPNARDQAGAFQFKIPVVFHRKTTPAFNKEIVVNVKQASQSEEVVLTEAPEWVTVNPGGVVLAKVKQDERDEDKLALQALNDPDPVGRTWAAYELGGGLLEGQKVSSFAQKTLSEVLSTDASPYVRMAVLDLFGRAKGRWLPGTLASTVSDTARKVTAKEFATAPLYLADTHGWSQFRSRAIGQLGRVDKDDVLPFLTGIMSRKNLPLDDLGATAMATATYADPKTPELLRAALKTHESRGYPYQFSILYSFGAYRSPAAAKEIKEITKTCSADLIGRMGWVVSDNEPLKTSPEWAQFLQEFVLENGRFGDDVKARLLHTVEEVKSNDVKAMLETVEKKSPSERIKQVSKKMLDKSFRHLAGGEG